MSPARNDARILRNAGADTAIMPSPGKVNGWAETGRKGRIIRLSPLSRRRKASAFVLAAR
jgi:hypothetical protein